jgi:hypothetical protein
MVNFSKSKSANGEDRIALLVAQTAKNCHATKKTIHTLPIPDPWTVWKGRTDCDVKIEKILCGHDMDTTTSMKEEEKTVK